MTAKIPPLTPPSPPPQHLVKFGEKAIELRLLSPEQVEEALAAQGHGRKEGLDRSVGAWLHDRGILDLVQVQAIMSATGAGVDRARLLPDIELIQLLGRGTSGAVYKGFSSTINTWVAVKVRSPRREQDDPNGARFKLEGEIGERLAHPNIVRLYSAGQTRDFIYHVLEFVEGQPLDKLLKQHGKLDEKFVSSVGVQICDALDCAGKSAIVHRDIKPANILVMSNGHAKLCDLGLAKDLSRSAALTAEGVLLGSPFYLAPEYARTGDVDARSDIYSLGVTLYHCASGFVPFPGKTAMEILQRVVREEAPDPRNYNPGLSETFVAVLKGMIAKDPGKRYQTPAEARDALHAVARGQAPPMSAAGSGRLHASGGEDSGAWNRLLSFFKRKPR